MQSPEDASVPLELIRQLADTAPVYYALGNHEISYMENGHDGLKEELEEAGAVVLDKEYRDIEVNARRSAWAVSMIMRSD